MFVQDSKEVWDKVTELGARGLHVKWLSNHSEKFLARGREFNVQAERVGATPAWLKEA